MCGGENIELPFVKEDKEKIEIVYSCDEAVYHEDDEGIKIFYSEKGDVVRIIIPKDEDYYIITIP